MPKFINIGDGGFSMASKEFISKLPIFDIIYYNYYNRRFVFKTEVCTNKHPIGQLPANNKDTNINTKININTASLEELQTLNIMKAL